jgi:hypothetical protein
METALNAQLNSDLFALGNTGQAKQEFSMTEIGGQTKSRLTFAWFSHAEE